MRKSRRALITVLGGCTLVPGVNAWAQTQGGGNRPATAAPAPAPMAAEKELVTIPVTVEQVDQRNRTMMVRAPDGEKVSLNVPPDVTNLENVKKGDKLEIDYQRAVAVSVLPGGAAGGGRATRTAQPSGQTQAAGGNGRQMISSTEVISVNRKDNTIKVKGQNGSPTQTVSVQDPSLQRQIQGLKPGDVVQITYTQAVAAKIRPRK